MSISQLIQDRIKKKPDRWVFSAADFIDLGSRTAAEKVLSRCCQKGTINRISQGLYMRPVYNSLFNLKVPAPTRSVLNAIMRKDDTFITDSNAAATNYLRLTNLVPAKEVYLTTGKDRHVFVGKRDIHLIHMGSKLSKWAGSPALTAVQSMFWLGNDMLTNTADLRDKFWRNISDKAKVDLIKHKGRLPLWAQTVIDGLNAH